MKKQMKDQSYQERLKRMKARIKLDSNILEPGFPDDVTVIGNPDLLKKHDHEIDEDIKKGEGNEHERR